MKINPLTSKTTKGPIPVAPRAITALVGLASLFFVTPALGQDRANLTADPFPELEVLLPRVAEHQKEVEKLLTQYTFTNKVTVYDLDKSGRVRSHHTDIYYLTPTPYEVFELHIAHDGQPVPQSALEKQQHEIERKLQQYEKKEQKGDLHPKDAMLFADILLKSKFTALRWEERDKKRLLVCAFEPKTAPARQGDLSGRIAGDMKGTMWISPEDAEIVRMEFTGASPLSLGWGFLGNVKGFEGFVEQQKVHSEVWLPSHQEYVAYGRELISGFRIRQVNDYTDYLKATTDVFQQIHAPTPSDTNISEAPK